MDLSRDTSVGRAFDREGGKKWDYVFCFAAETTFGKAEDVYAQRVGLSNAVVSTMTTGATDSML